MSLYIYALYDILLMAHNINVSQYNLSRGITSIAHTRIVNRWMDPLIEMIFGVVGSW